MSLLTRTVIILFIQNTMLVFSILVILLYDARVSKIGKDENTKSFYQRLIEQRKSMISRSNDETDRRIKRYLKKICKLDKLRFEKFMQIDFKNESPTELLEKFHEVMMDPYNMACAHGQRFGGKYHPSCKYRVGATFVCVDDLLNEVIDGTCLIYSVGIKQDWAFEDFMDDIGCKVFALDSTVSHPPMRGNNITFSRLGVSIKPNKLDTLRSILQTNGHTMTKIFYLKLDIEGVELLGLSKWLNSGALDYVQQIAIKFHLHKIGSTLIFFEIIKRLYVDGKYRLISYDMNECYDDKSKSKNRTYFGLANIVLQKITTDYRLIEKDCLI